MLAFSALSCKKACKGTTIFLNVQIFYAFFAKTYTFFNEKIWKYEKKVLSSALPQAGS